MDFLAEHFTVFGVDFQWWMPIVGGACAMYVLWPWRDAAARHTLFA
jgi:hypothetical protein